MRSTHTFTSEDRALATEALDNERKLLVMALHELPHLVENYKRDAADAAKYGVDVPFTDTMREAMEDAMRSIADLNAAAGEWSNR